MKNLKEEKLKSFTTKNGFSKHEKTIFYSDESDYYLEKVKSIQNPTTIEELAQTQ